MFRDRGFRNGGLFNVPFPDVVTKCHAEFWDPQPEAPSPFLLDVRAGKDLNWQRHEQAD